MTPTLHWCPDDRLSEGVLRFCVYDLPHLVYPSEGRAALFSVDLGGSMLNLTLFEIGWGLIARESSRNQGTSIWRSSNRLDTIRLPCPKCRYLIHFHSDHLSRLAILYLCLFMILRPNAGELWVRVLEIPGQITEGYNLITLAKSLDRRVAKTVHPEETSTCVD